MALRLHLRMSLLRRTGLLTAAPPPTANYILRAGVVGMYILRAGETSGGDKLLRAGG